MARNRSSLTRRLSKHLLTLEKIAEVGWNEIKTTRYIDDILGKSGSRVNMKNEKTGVIYKIGKGSNSIFLRADIDALPRSDGSVSHLCGHNAHTAALICAYLQLKKYDSELTMNNKSVYFVFQPAEETFPSGANIFLKKFSEIFLQCKYGFGAHTAPFIKNDTVLIKPGVIFSAGDYFEIEVAGKSAHIKDYKYGIDAIEGAMQVVRKIIQFQKKFASFGENVVFNVNTIKGGTVANRIADKVLLTGDIRWVNRKHQEKIKLFFGHLQEYINNKCNCKVKINYFTGYPLLRNNKKLTHSLHAYFKQKWYKNIVSIGPISLGTEDFSFFANNIPCLYVLIGNNSKYDLHHDKFNASVESALDIYDYFNHVFHWYVNV